MVCAGPVSVIYLYSDSGSAEHDQSVQSYSTIFNPHEASSCLVMVRRSELLAVSSVVNRRG